MRPGELLSYAALSTATWALETFNRIDSIKRESHTTPVDPLISYQGWAKYSFIISTITDGSHLSLRFTVNEAISIIYSVAFWLLALPYQNKVYPRRAKKGSFIQHDYANTFACEQHEWKTKRRRKKTIRIEWKLKVIKWARKIGAQRPRSSSGLSTPNGVGTSWSSDWIL